MFKKQQKTALIRKDNASTTDRYIDGHSKPAIGPQQPNNL